MENIAEQPLTQRIAGFESELIELQKKYRLKLHSDIDFPIYKILPDDVELAMIIIRKHGAVCKSSYIDEGVK